MTDSELERYNEERVRSLRFCPTCAHGYEWQESDPPEGLCPGCRRAEKAEADKMYLEARYNELPNTDPRKLRDRAEKAEEELKRLEAKSARQEQNIRALYEQRRKAEAERDDYRARIEHFRTDPYVLAAEAAEQRIAELERERDAWKRMADGHRVAELEEALRKAQEAEAERGAVT